MAELDLDKVLSSIGGWGKFQMRVNIPLCCVVIFTVCQMSYIFVARDIKYRCKIESCKNYSKIYDPGWLRNAIPHADGVPNRCLFYEPMDNNTCTEFFTNRTHSCQDYVFEKDQITIVQDFDIMCDENLWKLTVVGTISVLGELCCLPFAGFLSDRFGRKRMIVVSMFFSTTIGLLRSFSPSYAFYVILEFLDTALASGMYTGAFILALEIVDTKRRSTANTIICVAFAMGQVILGLVAWSSLSWRTLLRCIYSPGILIILSLWYIPESIRWLLSKNKTYDAWKILNLASKLNTGCELNRELLRSPQVNQTENQEIAPFQELLKSKALITRILLCSFTWICCNFPYYGLTIQSVALSNSEDVYTNFICTALVEIPAYIITQGTMDRIGRRKTLAFSLMLGGVSCILVHVTESQWLNLAIFLSGKFFITVAYTTLYIYTAEMFPTKSRHLVMAICSMFGRIGGMLAPQVPLLERVFKSLPLVIFSVMAVTSGTLVFWLPETLNSELPNEVGEAEDIEENS